MTEGKPERPFSFFDVSRLVTLLQVEVEKSEICCTEICNSIVERVCHVERGDLPLNDRSAGFSERRMSVALVACGTSGFVKATPACTGRTSPYASIPGGTSGATAARVL